MDSIDANLLRDQWGHIQPRYVHPSFYDPGLMRPSRTTVDYLLQIFSCVLRHENLENIYRTVFDSGNLFRPYHSVNTDVARRIRYLA